MSKTNILCSAFTIIAVIVFRLLYHDIYVFPGNAFGPFDVLLLLFGLVALLALRYDFFSFLNSFIVLFFGFIGFAVAGILMLLGGMPIGNGSVEISRFISGFFTALFGLAFFVGLKTYLRLCA